VRVVAPNDAALDDAASLAAAKFVFTPARRTNADGTTEAVSVVVPFEYWFQPAPPTASTSDSQPEPDANAKTPLTSPAPNAATEADVSPQATPGDEATSAEAPKDAQ